MHSTPPRPLSARSSVRHVSRRLRLRLLIAALAVGLTVTTLAVRVATPPAASVTPTSAASGEHSDASTRKLQKKVARTCGKLRKHRAEKRTGKVSRKKTARLRKKCRRSRKRLRRHLASLQGAQPSTSGTATTTGAATTGGTGSPTATTSTSTGAGGQPTTGQPAVIDWARPLAGFLGPQSEWVKRVDSAPLATNSDALVANLAQQATTRYNGVASFNWNRYNVGFYTVSTAQPADDLVWDNCQGKRGTPPQLYDPGHGAHFVDVPVPDDAVPAAGTDASLAIWRPDTDQLWELWRAHREADGWHACWGGRIDDFSTAPGYFADGMGVSASGLSVAAGVLGINETRVGQIDHAIRVGIPEVAHWRTFSYPAQRSDGNLPEGTENAIMEGQRFRLDPGLDLDRYRLHPIARSVAEAAQRYGVIVVDRAGAVTISTESGATAQAETGTNPWKPMMNGKPSYQVFANFPWDRMQALPVDWGRP